MADLKVGFLSMAKQHGVNLDLARENLESSNEMLNELDIELVSPNDLIITMDEAKKAVHKFKNEQIDLLLIQSGTFSSGNVFMEIIKNFDDPFALWGIPEPSIEEELSFNSLCGVNLHSSLLSNLNKKYKYFYGHPENEELKEEIKSWFSVNKVINKLKNTKIGLIGSHTPGFTTFGIDELNLRRNIGPEVVHVDLSTIYNESKNISQDKIKDFNRELKDLACNYEEIPEDKQTKYARTYNSFKNVINDNDLDGVAVKCWPEFIEDYGQAVCATLSKLVNDDIIAGCEGDVLGTITSIIQHELAGSSPFIADLVDINSEENTGVLWHCGVAPFCLAHSESCPRIGEEFGIGGINVEFPLKAGEVTITRLSYNKGEYRLLFTTGEAKDTLQTPDGTAALVEFDSSVDDLIDTIIYGGYEHHVGMVYGDIKKELKELARLWGIKTIEI